MFINSLSISNFRCFKNGDNQILLNVPNGELGSGLTILVGENGVGKTTILEAISLLTANPLFTRDKIRLNDFNEHSSEISIKGLVNENFDVKSVFSSPKTHEANGFYFHANLRKVDQSSKLVHPIVLDTEFLFTTNPKQSVERRQTATNPFGSDRISNFGIFYFDKNRSRHLTHSSQRGFKTQFDLLMEDLNFQVIKHLKEKAEDDIAKLATYLDEQESKVHSSLKDKVVLEAMERIKDFLDVDDLVLDFLSLLSPYENAFLAKRKQGSLSQIPISKLGSGIEIICSILLLDTIFDSEEDKIIYCIDEPELHLHPQAQRQLLQLLMEMSKTKQVIISTHSPYFTEPPILPKIQRIFLDDENNVSSAYLNGASVLDRVKEQRNFFFRHRDIFFAQSAIFLEGIQDYEKYSLFCELHGFEKLIPLFVTMNGCDHTLFFEEICKKLNIQFAAIVDRDFSEQRSRWARGSNQRHIESLKRFISEKDIAFNEAKFDSCMLEEVSTVAPLTDERAASEIEYGDMSIKKVNDKEILVLQEGEVNDYLNDNGEIISPKADEKEKELKAIFSYLSDMMITANDVNDSEAVEMEENTIEQDSKSPQVDALDF